MKYFTTAILAFGLLLTLAMGCGSSSEMADATACACEKGKAGEAVWCTAHRVGYFEKQQVACEGCLAEKTGGPACATCAAKKSG